MLFLHCSSALFWTHFTIWRFSTYTFGIVQLMDEIWKTIFIFCLYSLLLRPYNFADFLYIKFGNINIIVILNFSLSYTVVWNFKTIARVFNLELRRSMFVQSFFCISITINLGLLVLTPCHFYRFNNGIFSIFD